MREDGYEYIDRGDYLEGFRPDGRKPATLEEWENGEIPMPMQLVCCDETAIWMNRQIVLPVAGERYVLNCSCGENLGPKDNPVNSSFYAPEVAAHYAIPFSDAEQIVTRSWEAAVGHIHTGNSSPQLWKFEIDWYI